MKKEKGYPRYGYYLADTKMKLGGKVEILHRIGNRCWIVFRTAMTNTWFSREIDMHALAYIGRNLFFTKDELDIRMQSIENSTVKNTQNRWF